ncbi:MAG TPA: hypothetical protein VNJ01_14560 [Bacteriovoracaceae bacterium]|nr:hypothetical protein [Bacteriovoracaceae bacterium]
MKWLLPFMFLFAACLKDKLSPEAALKDFVETRFGHVVTRQFILEHVTGKMKQSLENISEEEFQKFSDLRNVKNDSFKVLSKSCQEKMCYLTYSISYRTSKDDKPTAASEVKKIAELHLVEGKWLIEDVSNVKTYHEVLEPIEPLQ